MASATATCEPVVTATFADLSAARVASSPSPSLVTSLAASTYVSTYASDASASTPADAACNRSACESTPARADTTCP